jgi:C_GCAxxG_C_C family probable redox protein
LEHPDRAAALFASGHACSQAVLMAYAPEHGLDDDHAGRIAAGFAGGMGVGGTCGALTGALMVLGLALCDETCVTREGRAGVAKAASVFAERFRARVGALDCPDVIGCDLRAPGVRAEAVEQGLFQTRCAPAVRAAAEILDDMLPPTGGRP